MQEQLWRRRQCHRFACTFREPCLLANAITGARFAAGSLSFASGYTFERANLGGNSNDLNGWFAGIQYSVRSWLGISGQFTNYFGTRSGRPIVAESFSAGPVFSTKLAHSIKPFGYFLLGDQRSQSGSSAMQQLEIQVGGGVQFPLTHNLDLKIVPAEYDWTKSSETSTYVTSIGLVIKVPTT